MSGPATIFALASGAGPAGVAVIRVSGPLSGPALRALSGSLPKPRVASLRPLVHAGERLDDALVLWFPAPASFTGEDVAELHVHGGAAVIDAVANALIALGLRLAEPGEFTRRAFENGKLDLTAAEGLADLIDAETEGQRRQALRQMEGALAALYDGWRADLLASAARLEALIDFPDEDLPPDVAAGIEAAFAALADAMDRHLADGARGERVRDGYRIAILGAPNAGKSSLLNALARREAAIVSDIPGTTRDVVEVRIVLAGYPVWIADTAGLREASDAIESEGVRRALERAADADLRLGVLAPGEALGPTLATTLQADDLLVLSKADLGAAAAPRAIQALSVSTRTGDGLAALEAWLAVRVGRNLAAGETPALTRVRHRVAVEAARDALRAAAVAPAPELAAEDARLAARALGRITGRIDVEDVLGEIFARFCIGK